MANQMASPSPRLYRLLGLLLLAALVMLVLKSMGQLAISWGLTAAIIWAPWALLLAIGLVVLAVRLLIQTVRR